jgi:hypothetical protein
MERAASIAMACAKPQRRHAFEMQPSNDDDEDLRRERRRFFSRALQCSMSFSLPTSFPVSSPSVTPSLFLVDTRAPETPMVPVAVWVMKVAAKASPRVVRQARWKDERHGRDREWPAEDLYFYVYPQCNKVALNTVIAGRRDLQSSEWGNAYGDELGYEQRNILARYQRRLCVAAGNCRHRRNLL